MLGSVRALLTEIIDYAGMFPPAKLPLEQALRNYAQYRASSENWLLGRFICPVGQLSDLPGLVNEMTPLRRLPIVVLGTSELHADAAAIRISLERQPRQVAIEGYECKWPASDLWQDASANGENHFFEVAFEGDWKAEIVDVVEELDIVGRSLKLRCGGEQASAFPTPEQLAFVLWRCRGTEVRLKFTAGLHHPVRHFDRQLGIKAHGFLNVFVAGALAHAIDLDEHTIRRIIEEENPTHFQFADERLGWQQHSITNDQIAAARMRLVTAFGSCSFEEPVADLREMGLLPPTA